MRPPATGMIIAPARMDQFASAAARSLASTGWPGRGGGRPETADSASSAATVTRTRTTKYSSLGLPGDSHGDPAVVTASKRASASGSCRH